MDKWLEQWNANYNAETDIARECLKYQKETYKGDPYLPWAFMERAFYSQDPEGELDFKGINYYPYEIRTQQGENITISTIVSPMVVMSGEFLGKEMTEVYPIQDNDYSAPRAINQNMINRAIQRCKVRLISKLTGIGWKIYEIGDLQFESKVTPTPSPKVTTPTPTPVETEQPSQEEEEVDETTKAICNLILGSDKTKMDKVLLSYNTSLIKSYGFAIDTTDERDDLLNKVNQIKNKEKFLKGLEKMLSNA